MKFYKTKLAAAFAFSALCFSPAVSASQSTSSSASVGSFAYTLYDLDPTDGVVASIAWIADTSDKLNYVRLLSPSDSYDTLYENDVDKRGQPVAINIPTGSVTSTVGRFDLHSAGSSTDMRTSYEVGSYYTEGFQLSAKTAVTFYVAAKTSLVSDVEGYITESGMTYSKAYSYAYMTAEGVGATGLGYQRSSDAIESTTQVLFENSGSSPKDRLLEVSYLNLSRGKLAGEVVVGAYVEGIGPITPVPEPETYALLLAGLGMLATIVRRRK